MSIVTLDFSKIFFYNSLMIEIRAIREAEIARAYEIMRGSFPKSYQSIFYLYPESTLVALENGEVIGGINLDIYNAAIKVGYIGWLYVDTSARGKGVGELLVDKAIKFLENDKKVDEILLCIEGDNPSSFKNFSRRGFEIMPLHRQLKLFRWNVLKVYKHASRFFDMGYFLWHKKRGEYKQSKSLNKSALSSLSALIVTIFFNTLLYSLTIAKFGLFSYNTLLIPLLVLSIRTISLALVIRIFKTKAIFLSWDTSWLSSLISLFLPFYFPSTGGVYIKGDEWSLQDKSKTLGIASIATVALEALLLLTFRANAAYLLFALPLFLLDTLFSFYPFCGFLASRIKRLSGKKYFLIYPFDLIVIIGIFFL